MKKLLPSLRNRQLQSSVLPYVSCGTCEVMNASQDFFLDSFYTVKSKHQDSCGPLQSSDDLFATGLLDSYTGRWPSSFIARFLSDVFRLHTRMPQEIRRLRKERPDDPLLDAMMAALQRHRNLRRASTAPSLITPWDMEQYAMLADASLRQAATSSALVADGGCRGVWAAGGVSKHHQALEMCVSSLGSSRAFGLARSGAERDRLVPLTMDHLPLREEEFRRITRAGGVVKSGLIDNNPYFSISRSFGHFSMKSDPFLSPSNQKMTATPTSKTWVMKPQDVLVMCNHSVFENSSAEDTPLEPFLSMVEEELGQGLPPHAVASSICDLAIHFGATHALQATVIVAQDPDDTTTLIRSGDTGSYSSWVEAAPVGMQSLEGDIESRDALLRDCARLEMELADLLLLRWGSVRAAIASQRNSTTDVGSDEINFFKTLLTDFCASSVEATTDTDCLAAFRAFAREFQSSRGLTDSGSQG